MLQLLGVSKTYITQTVLADISIIVNAGERVGLIGPNGCGKTTVLKIITGQEQPDRGRVNLDAHATMSYPAQGIATEWA